VLPSPEGSLSLHELLGKEPDLERFLSEVGLSEESVKTAEGGADIDLPFIEDVEEDYEGDYLGEEKNFLVCDATLVDEVGHWNPWTHDIEREQRAYMSEKTMKQLGVRNEIEIRGVNLTVKENNNVADGVVFVPNSYEESQPFDPGVRVGRLMRDPSLRIETYG
jgi:NADH-dependent fumarate reductase subunit C